MPYGADGANVAAWLEGIAEPGGSASRHRLEHAGGDYHPTVAALKQFVAQLEARVAQLKCRLHGVAAEGSRPDADVKYEATRSAKNFIVRALPGFGSRFGIIEVVLRPLL